MLVAKHRHLALYTVHWFLGWTLGSMVIIEDFDDRMDQLSKKSDPPA